jgi:hypothetical protein
MPRRKSHTNGIEKAFSVKEASATNVCSRLISKEENISF